MRSPRKLQMATFTSFPKSIEQFQEAVSKGLTGAPVLAVTSVRSLGSLFHLGGWVSRSRAIDNPHLPELLRTHKGSKSLYVKCPWELYSPVDLVLPGTPVAGFEARTKLLEVLQGRTIASVAFPGGGCDVVLELEGGMRLSLFVKPGGGDAGYTVQLEEGYWKVALDGTVTLSMRV